MRFLSVFRKSLREQARDLLALSLSLVFAPCMVFVYWLFFPSGSTTFNVIIINNDAGAVMPVSGAFNAGNEVVEAIKHVTYKDGKPLLVVQSATDRAQAEARLRRRDAAALIIIPATFSSSLAGAASGQASPATVTFVGDLTNSYYSPVAAMASGALWSHIEKASGFASPVQMEEIALGGSAARTEFENYVPGMLIFAVIMMIFMAAMTVTAEVESGTLRRLQITRMTAFDLLGGTGAALIIVGMVALLLAFVTARALGFRSQGPLWVAFAIGAVTMISIIGAGLVVACFSRTVNQAFLLANFPLAIFMFFSGSMFPLPRVTLFSLAGHPLGPYDILPATHAVNALHRVLTLGAGPGDVAFELSALTVLSLLYVAAGVWLFQRRHMKAV